MTSGSHGATPHSARRIAGESRDGNGFATRATSKHERFTRALATAFYWQGWKTVGAVATSVVAIGTAVVAIGTFDVSQKTLRLSQQTLDANTRQQASDRFGKAIEHLGSDNIDVRLGGIFALDKLAWDTPSEHPDVYNVLTSFVRGHAVVGKDACADSSPPGVVPSSPAPASPAPSSMAALTSLAPSPVAAVASSAPTSPASTGPRPKEDIQTVIYLVGRRNRQYDSMNESIDFSHACLRGASFLAETVADYSDVNMNSSDLRSANLGLAKLENAYLMGATLDDALIISAKLHGARLTYAHMWRAGLSGADLRGAHVANADLRSANLCNADLSDADLSGANLADVVYDSTTIWPRGFQPPPSRPTVC
jgi:Pentapeptide repeats (8 copies)